MDASAEWSKRRIMDADGGESWRSRLTKEAAASESCSCSCSCSSGKNGEDSKSISLSSDQSIASCYSSNGSTDEPEAETKCVDLQGASVGRVFVAEDEKSTDSDRSGPMRVFRSEAGGVKMSETKAAAESPTDSLGGSAAVRMPSEAELEDFFAAMEKRIQQEFIDKYNFDALNDVPLAEGRYEWVQLKQ